MLFRSLMIALYHQTKTPISFWCRRELNSRSLIQPLEILPVELTNKHLDSNENCLPKACSYLLSLIIVIDLLRREYTISYIFYSLEQDIILINMCGGVFPTTLGSLGLNPQLILFCFGFSPQ